MPLTPKQAAFVAEYLVDLNATQAAIRAGYSPLGAEVQGSRLLSNAKVAAEVAAGQAERAQRVGVTADRVLEELACMALSDVGDVLDFTGDVPRLRPPKDIPARARRAIASVKVKRFPERVGTDPEGRPLFELCEVVEFKLWDKNAAVQKAMQHLGMLVDKVDHTSGGAPFRFTLAIGEKPLAAGAE